MQTDKNTDMSESQKVAFSTLNLVEPLQKAIRDLGFEYCTPIQALSLKYTLRGFDVTGRAQTGTGKTAAFLITLIDDMLRNPQKGERFLGEPRALVIAPTRELAIQIGNDSRDLCKYTDLHTVTLVGGEDYKKQEKALDRAPVDIVVATPGRLLDFVQDDKLYLGLLEQLVIDEADRMLDMGFIPQVRRIIGRSPDKECRQTLLFSATFTPEIMDLAKRWAMDPIAIEVEPEKVATDSVEQIVYLVTTDDKYKLLYNLIHQKGADKIIVFSNRRDQVRKLADNLHRNGIECGMLSGEVAQNKRVQTLEAFREGKLQVLVATDVAGRGLHIDSVSHVINYTLPEESDDYVHRIGRTGRGGEVGTSVSFACEEDSFLLPDIEKTLGQKLPCVHPDDALLEEPPAFSRPSRFKAAPRSGGRQGGGGRSRAAASRPRRR
ncbi:MAG: ATP-dependent RNA helicase RhlB [Pseudomonadota bacterium]